jgi:hypothetical protein
MTERHLCLVSSATTPITAILHAYCRRFSFSVKPVANRASGLFIAAKNISLTPIQLPLYRQTNELRAIPVPGTILIQVKARFCGLCWFSRPGIENTVVFP